MRLLRRIVLPALLALAAYYAVFGGEYSILELRRARADVEASRQELVELERRIDSLRARADSLENDPATLERIARERFGMIREGETLYRFAAPAGGASPTGEAGPTP
ncbi:MAG: septum formation initiator family protein [Gemmatimonadota bacterium]|nr:septum formation initiator family protein [Gemmatimonadota bacterium]